MDVRRPLPAGTMPTLRELALRASAPSGRGGGAPAPILHHDGALGGHDGAPDGPDMLLPSGVRIRRRRIAGVRVSDAELLQAIRGVQLLPLQHQLVLARAGIPIELVPLQRLEAVDGTSRSVLGITDIDQGSSGRWTPTRIRVATRSPLANVNWRHSIGEVAQHEIGHAIAVLAWQDRSEESAVRYAERY